MYGFAAKWSAESSSENLGHTQGRKEPGSLAFANNEVIPAGVPRLSFQPWGFASLSLPASNKVFVVSGLRVPRLPTPGEKEQLVRK